MAHCWCWCALEMYVIKDFGNPRVGTDSLLTLTIRAIVLSFSFGVARSVDLVTVIKHLSRSTCSIASSSFLLYSACRIV